MPDGFNPHTELEKIYNLRELITECRTRVPKVLSILDGLIDEAGQTYIDDKGNERPALSPSEKMSLCDMIFSRAYGKPRQQVHVVTDNEGDTKEKRVQVFIPDNGRDSNHNNSSIGNKIIDVPPDTNSNSSGDQ